MTEGISHTHIIFVHGNVDGFIFLLHKLDVYKRQIQGHKRHLSEEDMARLKVSVDSRYRDRIAKSGSIMPVSYTHLDVYKRQGFCLS